MFDAVRVGFPFVAEWDVVSVTGADKGYYLALESACREEILASKENGRTYADACYLSSVYARVTLLLKDWARVEVGGKSATAALANAAAHYEWYVSEGELADLDYEPVFYDIVSAVLLAAVGAYAELRLATVKMVLASVPRYVGNFVVAGRAGRCVVLGIGKLSIAAIGRDAYDLPVLREAPYRLLLRATSTVDKHATIESFEQAVALPWDNSVGWPPDIWKAWMWIVAISANHEDYCYQQFYPPCMRFEICSRARKKPYGFELQSLTAARTWAETDARCTFGRTSAHVDEPGSLTTDTRDKLLLSRVGGPVEDSVHDKTDYYTLGLINKLFESSRVSVARSATSKESSVHIDAQCFGGDDLLVVARQLYDDAGQALSPKLAVAAMFDNDADDLPDSEGRSVSALLTRLAMGAVLPHQYYDKVHRAVKYRMRRPALVYPNVGAVFHIYDVSPADDGGGIGPWEYDKYNSIDGWHSYVARFDTTRTQTWCFTSPIPAKDIRMECTGQGVVDFKIGYVKAGEVVVWFSDSLRVAVRGDVCLRIWVPESGHSSVMPLAVRRYAYIPGYTIQSHSYVNSRSSYQVSVTVTRTGMGMAGCYNYVGDCSFPNGQHALTFHGIASGQPFRVLLRSTVADALVVILNGMRLPTQTRNYFGLAYDPGSSALVINVTKPVKVVFALVQVYDSEALNAAHQAALRGSTRRVVTQSMRSASVAGRT